MIISDGREIGGEGGGKTGERGERERETGRTVKERRWR